MPERTDCEKIVLEILLDCAKDGRIHNESDMITEIKDIITFYSSGEEKNDCIAGAANKILLEITSSFGRKGYLYIPPPRD